MFHQRNCSSIVIIAFLVLPLMTHGQEAVAQSAPTTLWRFLGIPQGMQSIRDVTVNRRGNYPGLERRDPLKRIADPANLESENPAIKAAAEIKQAEDMKQQKIKAIKYLATIGCGCYDKDGRITEALLAATDDCTPDVRLAAIEAIQDAACGNCCKKCGSTSCCNEAITARLSEIAYERDDSGCPIEPSAEIRAAACRTLYVCCPGGPPTGPIEEATSAGGDSSEAIPVPPEPAPVAPGIPGESSEEPLGIPGESSEASESETNLDSESFSQRDREPEASGILGKVGPLMTELREFSDTQDLDDDEESLLVQTNRLPLPVRPIRFQQSTAEDLPENLVAIPVATTVLPDPITIPKPDLDLAPVGNVKAPRRNVACMVAAVDYATGRISLDITETSDIDAGRHADVFRRYLIGERHVGELVVTETSEHHVIARVKDSQSLSLISVGDRVMIR